MRDSFIFYKSFYEGIKELSTEEQAKVVLAIMQYQFEEKEEELSGVPKAIFALIKPQLDANNTRYENGRKGGAPKGNSNAKKQLKQPKNNLKTTEKQPNVNENVNENENENENVVVEKEKEKETTTAVAFYLQNINPVASQFELEQVQDYENELPSDVVIYAMQKAIEQRQLKLSYIKGILRGWKSKGVVCLKQAVEESENRAKVIAFPQDEDRWEQLRKQVESEGLEIDTR